MNRNKFIAPALLLVIAAFIMSASSHYIQANEKFEYLEVEFVIGLANGVKVKTHHQEYENVFGKQKYGSTSEAMNLLGLEGWELVDVHHSQYYDTQGYIFKRRIK